jgi:DNA-binding NtrC family response regulator
MNKILVIENDKRTASMAVEELKNSLKEVSVYVCLTGLEGLKSLKRRSFDLVISESTLSDMTGLELLKGMEELGGHWPTIILSTPGLGDEAVRYMRSGVYDASQSGAKGAGSELPV